MKTSKVSLLGRALIALGLGAFVGFFLAVFIISSPLAQVSHVRGNQYPRTFIRSHDVQNDLAGPESDVGDHGAHSHENKTLQQKLFNEVKILCWIMTSPENLHKKAKHIAKTWGSRCNKLLLMSTKVDKSLENVIALPVGEGRNNLWAKTKEAFRFIYRHHLEDADWFLKADDDTYVVVENLRYMLYPYSPKVPVYFGHRFKPYTKQGYTSGGAGYVLSKEAVMKLVEEGIPDETGCKQDDSGSEDVEVGKCLEFLNVTLGDSRDSEGRGTFFPYSPESHLIPGALGADDWFFSFTYYKVKQGMECCSDHAISFHYIEPNQMYVMDYFLYHLRPYGIDTISQSLPTKLNRTEMETRFRESEKDKAPDVKIKKKTKKKKKSKTKENDTTSSSEED